MEETIACADNTIKVLHVIGKLGSGGIETLLVSLIENMSRSDMEIHFLLFDEKVQGFYDDLVKRQGCELDYIKSINCNNKIRKTIIRMKRIKSFLEQQKYTIVHLHGGPQQYIYAYIARRTGAKAAIIHSHSVRESDGLRTKMVSILKYCFRNSVSYYLACSEEAAKFAWPKNVNQDKCALLKNGIPVDKYRFNKTTRDSFRKKYGLNGKFVIGHVGRFAKEKNHEFLLEVFDLILKENSESVLLLIGEGPLETPIREKANKLGIADNVLFFGTTYDVASALMGMDVMCFPSVCEGLGIAVIEAQAASLQVIASDNVPDSADITGYIKRLNLNDPARVWADAINAYRGGYRRTDMSDAIRKAGYDIKNSAEKLEKLYRNLASTSGGGSRQIAFAVFEDARSYRSCIQEVAA